MTNATDRDELSKDDLLSFRENGYIGPFNPVLDESQIDSIAKVLLSHSQNKEDRHPLYGRYAARDWHLVYPELTQFVGHPRPLGQLRSIMGDNLILWRSNIFYKPPGTGPIGWHQDFGTFSGEDIGNNQPSLLPTHLKGVNEEILKQYLPDSIQLSTAGPAPDQSDFWNMTLWVALTDIDADMGVLRFLKKSFKTRFPVRMGLLTESDFWQDPFANIHGKMQLITACNASHLVLDVDTSQVLRDIRTDDCSFDDLKQLILRALREMRGSITVSDEVRDEDVVTFPMKKGSYIIFSERTLHGSLANTSEKERLAINFRVTPSSTLIYPFRLRGQHLDGFNLDVRHHASILLCGQNLNPFNAVKS